MSTDTFLKPPLLSTEIERKTEEFLTFSTAKDLQERGVKPATKQHMITRTAPVRRSITIPTGLAIDLDKIAAITGVAINSICIELLAPAAREKLNDLEKLFIKQ